MSFRKNNTDDKEDDRPHQLEKLQARNVVDKLYFSQVAVYRLLRSFNNKFFLRKLPVMVLLFLNHPKIVIDCC